ncbi:ABC transporter substrate-binding protein [Acutalibacter muris]|uniref:ABC transporter substrate-binding protein n=1 Tax=Acutalibacter muris TaxID=1796620 RepID=A0A1Z2XSR9_9FIRM|nr:ABC transporter substrate-binding protein [Acutalibacter muris]ANU55260.1 LacI family transcriptional regulator [Hungateiclostridiaceae bacterium KB18]ASB41504.1 LacI family transcriptional regulator [Acutalibacter muris]MCI9192021.1 substrate-binding domain-containing protein [Acutalibacter muris]MCI9543562.1 substrate-binding domain-containing protein [Acutalibacter muris]QQR30763.1 ABC transporter substrate-binding protein [Acutalibacter muris]
MKKIISLLLVLMLIVGCFAACGNDTSSSSESGAGSSSQASDAGSSSDESSSEDSSESSVSETASGEKFKVGILAPAVTHGWVAGVAYYAEERCKELSDTVEYKLLTSDNAEEMTNQIDELKTWGVQAVVAFPQWEGMEDPIKGLVDEGIQVVNFDIVIDVDGVYHVAGDNVDMGTQSAQYIVDKIGTTGKVVVLEVPSSGSVSELRKKGFDEKIKEIAPDMEIEYYSTQFTREAGLKDFADILNANSQIDAVFSMDDETSIGVLQAIDEAKRTDIKVVTGGGGCQEYFNMMPENENIWIQSALYSPDMVKDAVDMAVSLLKGETVDQEKIIPTTVVDRENCADYLDENSPY